MSREHELASLAKREEGIRLALEYPSGAERPGGYVAHYSRAGCLKALGEIAAERARLQVQRPQQPRRVPATTPAGRTSRAGHPTVPARHRRKTLKLTSIIIVADVAVVAYVEKGLIAVHAATAGHHAVPPAHPAQLVLIGLVFALPTLLILLGYWLRGRSTAPAATAPRPVVPFGQYGGRR